MIGVVTWVQCSVVDIVFRQLGSVNSGAMQAQVQLNPEASIE